MMSADFLLLFDSHDHRRHVNAESHIKGPNFRIFFFFFATFLQQRGTNELTHEHLELFLLIISN